MSAYQYVLFAFLLFSSIFLCLLSAYVLVSKLRYVNFVYVSDGVEAQSLSVMVCVSILNELAMKVHTIDYYYYLGRLIHRHTDTMNHAGFGVSKVFAAYYT